MASKYKINRSNYTVKSRHQLVSGGVVYERDFMTTTNLGAWDSGSIPYGESNFRMVERKTENARRRSYRNSWLKPACGIEGDYWTASCVDKSGVSEENIIKIKPNYHSLLDFAYYGSCQELVKSTIRNIVRDFPGELSIDSTEKYIINGVEYTGVENPFGIDPFCLKEPITADCEDTVTCLKIKGYEQEDLGIKAFAEHFNRYVVVLGDSTAEPRNCHHAGHGDERAITDVRVEKFDGCDHGDIIATAEIDYDGGTLTIYKIIYDKKPLLFTDFSENAGIRPDDDAIEEFFDNLDDFGRLLLNRDSIPLYTATIDWPHETEYGVMTYRRSFTWPLDGAWNLDVRTINYENYLDELLSIAEFYDEGYTDNLWRMLTHDSIKSMDLAFSNPSKDEGIDDYIIGSTKLEGLMWAYGRQFDEIKRAIDNIRFNNNITYDEVNNMPDYFLSDSLELSGWEVYGVDKCIESGSTCIKWEDPVSGVGVERSYTTEDANNLFLRELKLNSKALLRKKGTRDGIISLLGLFGLVYGEDYTFDEYVAVVNDNIERKAVWEQFNIERLNSMKASSETSTENNYNPFDGLPFTYVENDTMKYIIPWFDKNLTYDQGMYFQMKGGWIEETIKYLTVVDNFESMFSLPVSKAYRGAICYVEDVGDENAPESAHYFILRDTERSYEMAGWTGASEEVITYIESLVDDFKGNNPHVGYGHYDSGQAYIDRIKKPFQYLVDADSEDNPMFNDAAYAACNGSYDEGFRTTTISMDENVVDNKKVWYFGDTCTGMPVEDVYVTGELTQEDDFVGVSVTGELTQKDEEAVPVTVTGGLIQEDNPTNVYGVSVTGELEELPVATRMAMARKMDADVRMGTTANESWEITSNQIDYKIYDFECDSYSNEATESAANSIINTKTLSFRFTVPSKFRDEFKCYFENSILPYLKQMLPSTTLWGDWVDNIIDVDDDSDSIPVVPMDTTSVAKPIAVVVDVVAFTGSDDTINDDFIDNYTEGHDSRNW